MTVATRITCGNPTCSATSEIEAETMRHLIYLLREEGWRPLFTEERGEDWYCPRCFKEKAA